MWMTIIEVLAFGMMASIVWLAATGVLGLYVMGNLLSSYHVDEDSDDDGTRGPIKTPTPRGKIPLPGTCPT